MKKLRLLIVLVVLLPLRGAEAQQKFLLGYSSFSANQTPIWVSKIGDSIRGGIGSRYCKGNQGARVASLQSGGSDAIIVNPGLGPALKERGNIIADFTELPIPYPQQTVSVRERSIKSDPDFIERVLKGVVAGNVFSMDPRNKERVKQITAKYLRLDSVDKAEEHYQSALKVMALKPYVNAAVIASMIEFIAESDPLIAKVKPEMVINHTILKKLDDSGFIEQLAKRN